MNQNHTPLYSALVAHKSKNPISFHVPGHKGGELFPQVAREYNEILKLDVTELTGLDDLHDPEGVIREAERLTADLYQVEKTFFLVNGSTVGNLAMILATCQEDDIVLVQRNSHKSILNGLQLAGVRPVFLSPEYDHVVKVPVGISQKTVREALKKYPEAKAVILTNPNYYGMTVDLTNIIELAHQHHIPVLVDEAHGAHFILEGFPTSAVHAKADVIVNSAHKTLPAMTMGSYLHVNSNLVDSDKIAFYLKMLQSSSPSYPIMASLDLARYYLAMQRKIGTNTLLEEIQGFKRSLQEIPQLQAVESNKRLIKTDPLKITLQSHTSKNGFQIQAMLEQHGIYSELADPNNVLFVLPLSYEHIKGKMLAEKINAIIRDLPVVEPIHSIPFTEVEYVSELALSYKQIKRYNKKVVSVEEAVGKVSAEMIIPYPPGIPVLMAGETITSQQIKVIRRYVEQGARFQGNNLENNHMMIVE